MWVVCLLYPFVTGDPCPVPPMHVYKSEAECIDKEKSLFWRVSRVDPFERKFIECRKRVGVPIS
jgi:hypothetical protein